MSTRHERRSRDLLIGSVAVLAGLGVGYFVGVERTGRHAVSGFCGLDGERAGHAMSAMGEGMKHGHGHPEEGMSMDAMMIEMTERLAGKTGAELDRVFLEDMIVHHEGAVAMAHVVSAGTQRPELREFAADIIKVQSGEIEMMRGWLSKWYVPELE